MNAPENNALAVAPVAILGVPFDHVTTVGTLDRFDTMILTGRPHYVVTANVDFLVQARGDIELLRILIEADLVVCDGTPLVWASGWLGNRLPERVAGSDLVPALLRESERRGYRIFLLGGTEESIRGATERIAIDYPGAQLVGAYSPPFRSLLEMDHDEIKRRVQAAAPNVLLVAFGCPKQEKWINMQYRSLGVPVSIGVGATVDFLAGQVSRAPVWMRSAGLEWVYRLCQEPGRLFKRYATDLYVFGHGIFAQCLRYRAGGAPGDARNAVFGASDELGTSVLRLPSCLDREAVGNLVNQRIASELSASSDAVLVDTSDVRCVDSTGMGWLATLSHACWRAGRPWIFFGGDGPVKSAWRFMRWESQMTWCPDRSAAIQIVAERLKEKRVEVSGPGVAWHGEITAANLDDVLKDTEPALASLGEGSVLVIRLEGVRFIDSAGVGLMVRLKKEAAKRGGEVRFESPGPTVLNVLQKLKLETFFLGQKR